MNKIKVLTVVMVFLGSFIITAQDPHAESGLVKGIVQEVLQVSSYTYLNVLEEDGTKRWLAVPTMEAELGEVYYYKGGMEMPNFTSSELNKTFDSVIFLGFVTNADLIDAETGKVDQTKINSDTDSKQPTLDKLELSFDDIEGGLRIKEIFENKQKYKGKKVKVQGEVTKFSGGIMSKNWVHFQDGTEYEGKYDLMITTQEMVNVGDIVVFEGILSLDKDFGAGYFYDVILEEAEVLK